MKSERASFIEETQLFQRIAGVTVTDAEILGKEWDEMRPKARKFALENNKTHRAIQDMAVAAGQRRR